MFKKSESEAVLQETINAIHVRLAELDPATEEYSLTCDQLVKLQPLKNANASQPLSKDTLALIIGNLLGICVIVGHERANVIGSKALSFVKLATR